MITLIIIGIDPGLALTGYGIIKDEKGKCAVVTYGCIGTAGGESTASRLSKIYQDIRDIIIEYRPDTMAVEELYFNKNARSAFLVGEARGVVLLAAAHLNLEAFDYTPLQVKQSVVGYGRATKKQVKDMVKISLNLKESVKPDDASDALAVALCHLYSRRLKEKGLL